MNTIAKDMPVGLCCSCCYVYFENPHGFPVLCNACSRKLRPPNIPRATEKER